MNRLIRWGKFNLVGAVGMAVQLGVLALINHVAPGHYMVATAAALEITLLHNFVWHLHYTWRDRRCRSAIAGPLIRFHLSNGLVSMLGNLALMPVLVEGARIPVVLANAIAILCCSIVNFLLGDQWAFVPLPPTLERQIPGEASPHGHGLNSTPACKNCLPRGPGVRGDPGVGHPPLSAAASPTPHE